MVKEGHSPLLRNIFFLDVSHPTELSLIPEFEQIEDRFYTLYKDFYHIIFDPQYSCEENFDRLCVLFSQFCILFAEIFQSNRITSPSRQQVIV